MKRSVNIIMLSLLAMCYTPAQMDTTRVFKIFQFPQHQIPRIDGEFSDWDLVPEKYAVGIDQMKEDEGKHDAPNKETLDIKVKVGWVKGLNRLYFLYEAYDDFWDFTNPGLEADIFEVVVDGDASGGPFIDRFHPNEDLSNWEKFYGYHGVHAQNYHIFTPAEDKSWCLAWGSQPWIKDFPYANSAYSYDFKHGESGKLQLEFYITLYDFASPQGVHLSVESKLYENKEIGLCWAVIDYDGNSKSKDGFWNLSPHHTMYGNASLLRRFKLMPAEQEFVSEPKADWTFNIIDHHKRIVSFKDNSTGNILKWKWDFGDGKSSEQQNPIHTYAEGGQYIVTLHIETRNGTGKMTKVWDITLP